MDALRKAKDSQTRQCKLAKQKAGLQKELRNALHAKSGLEDGRLPNQATREMWYTDEKGKRVMVVMV
jgi:hypothetical protein